MFLPTGTGRPVPVFLGLNFWGNHTLDADPGIRLSERWMRDDPERGVENHRALPESRGASASRWPIGTILARGYGLATAYAGDLEPDHPEGHRDGVRATLAPARGATPWGAIGVWAWGLSRARDALTRVDGVDADRIAVVGHSRLGKAALWAAAQDERFAMAISNDSGCMGAALSRRRFGETIAFVTMLFPHWFPERFRAYANREDELPVDQHMLLALIAPRPLYVASAEDDAWADPTGEFAATREASEVFRFLGGAGLPVGERPPVGRPVLGQIGYHVRAGEHDLTSEDWAAFLDFADLHLPPPSSRPSSPAPGTLGP